MKTSLFDRIAHLSLAVVGAGLVSAAVAQTVPGRVEQNPADRLLKEQRDREREAETNRAAPRIAAPSSDKGIALPLDADPLAIADAEPMFRIDRIELAGNTVLSQRDVERIVQPFLRKPLGANRINLLLRRVTEAFIARGYITTRAYLAEQNLATGALMLTVVPGRIEAFQLNGRTVKSVAPAAPAAGGPFNGGWFTDAGTLAAFPLDVGDTLNLQDLEQGVEQINRLRRNQAELQILPGQTPGGSVIALNNRFGDRYRINLGIDNYGSHATGITRSRLGIDADNALGLQEALSLAYVGSLDTNALVASAAAPWGYNTFSYTASYSEYQNLIGDTALLYGNTTAHNLGWNRVLTRSQSGRTGLDLTLSVRKAEREVNNIMLTPQNLTVARLAWNTLQRFAKTDSTAGNWTLDIGVWRGLNAIRASSDADGIDKTDAHSQFSKLDLTATVFAPLPAGFGYRGSFNGQWSRVGLFGSEQIYAGGVGSVRGFAEGGISGDRGFVLRNESQWLSAPQPELFGKPLALQPYAFVDAGRTQLIAQGQWEQLAGAGVGLRAQWRNSEHVVLFDALVGAPLTQPAEVGSKKAVAQASLNWTF
jgi:hemolysin activation/secretion protein